MFISKYYCCDRKHQDGGKSIKGGMTQDIRLQVFFMNQFPRAPRAVSNVHENSRRYSQLWVDTAGSKLFTRVNNTGDLFIAGVVVTADKLLPVSLTPVITNYPGFSSMLWHQLLNNHRYRQHRRLVGKSFWQISVCIPTPWNGLEKFIL